ncbi:substrate-binding domain-containing protein [Deinococcus knuensis]|uniref:HTH cro/C1-type domain-containing protein n=1 Tax=Deinococcus knuensis TaxID=1837380 RepID=A0ABQ2SKR7_9DEIO|nr:substrate-binding domain-containing protein [Deinococcus knuensis]GGS28777.1 hypothetical protein GCM10008961_20580 [Deinococcus knuensis]
MTAEALPTLDPRVRERREALGLRASDVARQVGITRQALHRIESGASLPGTLLAFTLARALTCRVDDLFTLRAPGPDPLLSARSPAPLPAGTRVALASLPPPTLPPSDRLHSDQLHPDPLAPDLLAVDLRGDTHGTPGGFHVPADGVVQDAAPGGRVTVRPLRPVPDALALAARTAVLVGCDPALDLLVTHAARQPGGTRVILRSAPSLAALRGVARGEAHAAGIHLWDARSGTSNLPFTQAELGAAQLFTLWTWEQGLLLAPGNPLGVRGPADLTRPGVRLLTRERGAGSRLLLSDWLRRAGLPDPDGWQDGLPTARSPLEAAARVASGQADAAPGPRSAAQAAGLDFLPLQPERFDLVVPDGHAGHPAILALLAAARSDAFRADLSALGGYDPAQSGEPWQRSLPAPAPTDPPGPPNGRHSLNDKLNGEAHA